MLNLFFVAALLAAPADTLATGNQLNYRGSIEQAGVAASRKAFDLTYWVAASGPDAAQLWWLVEERGHGEWPWPQHFGRLTVDANGQSTSPVPSLYYDRGEGQTIVPLPTPRLFVEKSAAEKPLAAEAAWQQDKLAYLIEKPTQRAERAVWQVVVRDPFGPKRTLWAERNSLLLVGLSERVIMGRGDEYVLKLELVGSEQLAADAMAKLTAAGEALSTVRTKLAVKPDSPAAPWTAEQTALLEKELPQLRTLAAGSGFEKLALAAGRDLSLQSGRNTAVAELAAKFVGQKVDKFSIDGLAGEKLAHDKLAGQVTVLHFWDYRDEPLQEPYGQVGYLDFLVQRHKAAGLKVYGVAVDGRLADEKTRGSAERSVKKLKAFMNLSYPVLLDAGPLLKQFGDPRVVGAALPLFVVVGPDGKIVHYHVGTYEVRQDQGLKELDQVVTQTLGKK